MNEAATPVPEKVRLVIWDLDDTFWEGTLTEGGIRLIESHIEIIKTLSARGIVNSICSKNNPAQVREVLEQAGLWDYFVFCRVAWAAKGAMIRSIVESSQLRPETIMFIDDNPINLNEVRHSNPGLQLAGPEFIKDLLADWRFKGKDDSELTRLAQYKVLEKKELDRTQFADASSDFLRQSDVQISFHQDVLEEFDRIHELINRTNQLNFTKNRISEDRNTAYAEMAAELRNNPGIHAAYVKVSDKYGEYGIVGFYMSKIDNKRGRHLQHFLFSCRTLNMGIEQFVYSKIGRQRLEIVGEVVSELNTKQPIDWITVVDDAEKRGETLGVPSLLICMRGSCDLDQVIHYLGHQFSLVKEFPYPHKGWGVPMPAVQFASIFDELKKPEHQLLMKRLPSLHPNVLNSRIATGEADLFVLAFGMEEQWNHYRYRETGLVVPLKLSHGAKISAADLLTVSYEEARQSTKIELTEEEWRWFQESFDYAGQFDAERFAGNIADMFERLKGKQVIVVLSNTRHGPRSKAMDLNAELNDIVERVAGPHAPHFIRFDDLVQGDHEVIDAHHFRREVYPRLADAIKSYIVTTVAGTAPDPAAAAPAPAIA